MFSTADTEGSPEELDHTNEVFNMSINEIDNKPARHKKYHHYIIKIVSSIRQAKMKPLKIITQ